MTALAHPKSFDPARMPFALLEATLSAENRALTRRLCAALRSAVESGNAALHMVCGGAGWGKSHVLAFARAKLLADLGGGAVFCGFVAEGVRGLDSADELIRACLTGHSDGGAQAFFEDSRHGRPGVLFLDDVDTILTGLGKGQWKIFETFVRKSGSISLVMAARNANTLEKVARLDELRVYELKPLGIKEAQSFFGRSAGAYGANRGFENRVWSDEGRSLAQALLHIVRCNARWTDRTASFAQGAPAFELGSWVMELVDKAATPYYEAILRRLSGQQYRILDGLAKCEGHAVTVKDLASSMRLPSQTVSRQLYDLREGDLVRSTPVGRESFYELSDPVLRFVFDARNGRANSIERSCSFVERWFEVRQLQTADRSSHIPVLNPETGGADISAADKSALEEIFHKGTALSDEGKHEEAIAVWNEALERFGSPESPRMQLYLVSVLLNKGADLLGMRRLGYAIQTYDEILNHCAMRPENAFMELGTRALHYKMECFLRRGENVEALEVLDSILASQPRDVAAIAQRTAILFELGEQIQALESVQSITEGNDATGQTILAANLIGMFASDADSLRRILSPYAYCPDCLLLGLLMWVQDLLPLEPERASELEQEEQALRDVFADYDEARGLLDFVSVARRDALGDRRARFTLPLEQRALIAPVDAS